MKTMKQASATAYYPELRGTLAGIRFPALVEIKLDGALTWFNSGEPGFINQAPFFSSKTGSIRYDCPPLSNIRDVIRGRQVHLIGELYMNEGKSGQLYDLLANSKSDELKYRPFDVLSVDGKNVTTLPLIDRIDLMHELGVWVPQFNLFARDKAHVEQIFQDITQSGYEGIVVKSLNEPYRTGPCTWVKLKHKDVNEFRIAMIEPVKERMEVEVKSAIGLRRVGVKIQNKDKQHVSVGDTVMIEHQGILSGGGLRHPVYKGRSSCLLQHSR